MDVARYTQARYGRLIEHAVELGAPEGTASAYVDQVLLDQRRRIKRADDPDPLVREALAKAIRGQREGGVVGLLSIVVVVGVVLVTVGLAALLYDPPPKPLPSLFGYDGAQAEKLLEDRGYDVQLRLARACEPQGLVLGTTPRVGDLIADGASVTVRTAVPSDDDCLVQYQNRSDAWELIAWARGVGPAPAFAETVEVVVDGELRATLTDEEAVRQDGWSSTVGRIAEAAAAPADTRNGMPSLTVVEGTPPETTCGIVRPTQVGERDALRLAIDPARDNQTADCPLTVDLYRTRGDAGVEVTDTVVVYTPVGPA